MTDLEKLIQQSREQLAAMSPEEKHEMYAAQKASYVRAEMAMGTDADEAAYRADVATPLTDPRVKALQDKARAVVDRWDSPQWKDLRHTGTHINELRDALSALDENK